MSTKSLAHTLEIKMNASSPQIIWILSMAITLFLIGLIAIGSRKLLQHSQKNISQASEMMKINEFNNTIDDQFINELEKYNAEHPEDKDALRKSQNDMKRMMQENKQQNIRNQQDARRMKSEMDRQRRELQQQQREMQQMMRDAKRAN